jgi:hypothetical protein
VRGDSQAARDGSRRRLSSVPRCAATWRAARAAPSSRPGCAASGPRWRCWYRWCRPAASRRRSSAPPGSALGPGRGPAVDRWPGSPATRRAERRGQTDMGGEGTGNGAARAMAASAATPPNATAPPSATAPPNAPRPTRPLRLTGPLRPARPPYRWRPRLRSERRLRARLGTPARSIGVAGQHLETALAEACRLLGPGAPKPSIAAARPPTRTTAGGRAGPRTASPRCLAARCHEASGPARAASARAGRCPERPVPLVARSSEERRLRSRSAGRARRALRRDTGRGRRRPCAP